MNRIKSLLLFILPVVVIYAIVSDIGKPQHIGQPVGQPSYHSVSVAALAD